MRMALWQYKKNASLTEACDSAVDAVCSNKKAKEINGVVIGTYGQCLVSAAQNKKVQLEPDCGALVGLASQEGAHAGGTVDNDKLDETLKKIAEVGNSAHVMGCMYLYCTVLYVCAVCRCSVNTMHDRVC